MLIYNVCRIILYAAWVSGCRSTSQVYRIVATTKFYGARYEHGSPTTHFPQTLCPIFSSFPEHMRLHPSRSKPSFPKAEPTHFCMQIPHLPVLLNRHLSPSNGVSGSISKSVTTEKYLPQQPDSEMSMLFSPKLPSPAILATCLCDQMLYVPI